MHSTLDILTVTNPINKNSLSSAFFETETVDDKTEITPFTPLTKKTAAKIRSVESASSRIHCWVITKFVDSKSSPKEKEIGYSKQKTGGLGPKPVDDKSEIAKKNKEFFKNLLL